MKIKTLLVSTVCIICFILLLSCNAQPEPEEAESPHPSELPTITIASKSLTEQYILMSITSLLLRNEGYHTEEIRFLDSPSIRHAIEEGVIDMYWEYTNTARMFYHKFPPIYDKDDAFEAVKEYDEQLNLVWLERSDFNSSWGIIVKKSFSEQHEIETITDLMEHMKQHAPSLTFATNEEFLIREDGLKHLQNVYHFTLEERQLLPIDSDLLTLAVKEGRVEVSVGMVSDSRIAENDLIVLEDDQQAFPPYHAAPLVNRSLIEAHPEVREILENLSKNITYEDMIQLNYQVDVLHQDVAKVSKAFLKERGLLE